jgi:hypothetical protein
MLEQGGRRTSLDQAVAREGPFPEEMVHLGTGQPQRYKQWRPKGLQSPDC